MPTAPEIAPVAAWANARSSRSALRWASIAKPASLSPNEVGSAWTPWVRPTHSVPACSRARSASAAASARAPGRIDLARAARAAARARCRARRRTSARSGSSARPGRRRRRARRRTRPTSWSVTFSRSLTASTVKVAARIASRSASVGPVERLGGGDLDVAPGGHAGLVGPDGAELGPGVARDHACEDARRQHGGVARAVDARRTPPARPAASARSRAARRARRRPTSTTSAARRSPAASVWAATTPGSAADRPAPAMITRRPRICAFFA